MRWENARRETGRANFNGGCSAASRRRFSGHWDLSPARATSPPRGAADLRYWFSGGKQNRGVSTIFHWLRKGEGEGWEEGKQDDSFCPSLPLRSISICIRYFFFFYHPSRWMSLFYLSEKLLHINSLNFAFSQFIKTVNCVRLQITLCHFMFLLKLASY